MEDVHNNNKKKWRQGTTLLNTRMNQKGEIYATFEIGSEGNVVEEAPDSVAEKNWKPDVFKNGVYRFM